MFISLPSLLLILEHYKYLVIFPITVVEGPIIMIISGFLVYLGFLNVFAAYVLLAVADTVGDSLYYLIGRYWRRTSWIKKIAHFLGYDEKSEEFLEEHFRRHKMKTFLLAKISHGIGGSVQIASGIAGVPYSEFLGFNILGTLPKTAILMAVGYYLGGSYLQIDSVLDTIAAITFSTVVVVVFYVISRKLAKSFFAKDK